MKMLVISNRNDFRIQSLINPLRGLMEIGVMREFSAEGLDSFAPDIVFTDDMQRAPDGFDLSKVNELPAFIDLLQYAEPVKESRYVSDFSYVGDIADFGNALPKLTQSGYNVKHFFSRPSGLSSYCGYVSHDKMCSIYHNAKACPIPAGDPGFRELDIIMADGNPMKYKDMPSFLLDAAKAADGKLFPKKFSRATITKNHTNFDRVADILEGLGHSAVAKKVRSNKPCDQ